MPKKLSGASYLQVNGAEGQKNDRLKKEKEGKEIELTRVLPLFTLTKKGAPT